MPFPTQFKAVLAGAALVATVLPVRAEQTIAQDFPAMFKEGDISLNLRYRYEYVDDDGFDDEAKASTLRSRLTFASAVSVDLALKQDSRGLG